MALPSIGTLPPIGAPPPGAQLFSALGQMPQQMQQAQLQQVDVEAKKAQAGQQLFTQLGQYITADPSRASDPQLIARVQHISKITGIPAPLKDGAIDVEALTPKKAPGEMTPQDREYLMGVEPTKRKTVLGTMGYNVGAFPPELFTDAMPVSYTLGSGQRTALQNDLQKEFAKVADPAGAGPQGLVAWVKLNEGNLKAIGVKDPVQIVDDPILQQALQKRADVETQRLVTLGILKPEAEMKYKTGYLSYLDGKLRDEVNRTGIQQGNLDERKKRDAIEAAKVQGQLTRWDAQTKNAQGHLAVAQQNLQRLLSIQGPGGATAVLKYTTTLKGVLASAQSGYDSLLNQARQYTVAIPPKPVPPEILQRLQVLKQQIDTTQPMVDAATAAANEGLKRAISGASSTNAIPVPGANPAGGAPKRTGRVAHAAGKPDLYENADGSWTP